MSELELSYKNETDKNSIVQQIKKDIELYGFEKSVAMYSESDSAKNSGKIGFVSEKSLSKEIFKN